MKKILFFILMALFCLFFISCEKDGTLSQEGQNALLYLYFSFMKAKFGI